MDKEYELIQNAPIFIVGYMHSGTTLLQQILGRHPDLYIAGGETRHFSNLDVTRKQFPDLQDPLIKEDYLRFLLRVNRSGYATVNFIEGFDEGAADLSNIGITPEDFAELKEKTAAVIDYNTLFVMVYDYLMARAEKKRWLDKLPGYVYQVPQIAAVVPDAVFIELVRDPRDILASKKKRRARGGGFDPIWDTVAWRASIRAGDFAAAQLHGRMLRVRYEDLVTTPEMTVPRICSFLNMTYSPEMLSVGWINTTTGQVGKGEQRISSSAVGKWKQQLSAGDITISQRIAQDELADNDYQFMPIPALYYLSTPGPLARSGGEFFYRLYSKWRQGGTGYMMNVLSNYQRRFRGQSGN